MFVWWSAKHQNSQLSTTYSLQVEQLATHLHLKWAYSVNGMAVLRPYITFIFP